MMVQPGGAMRFRHLSCLNRGLALSLNNHYKLFGFAWIFCFWWYLSFGLTWFNRGGAAVCLSVFKRHVLSILEYEVGWAKLYNWYWLLYLFFNYTVLIVYTIASVWYHKQFSLNQPGGAKLIFMLKTQLKVLHWVDTHFLKPGNDLIRKVWWLYRWIAINNASRPVSTTVEHLSNSNPLFRRATLKLHHNCWLVELSSELAE